MNDDFLHKHRQAPRRDFAEALRQRLHEEDTPMTTQALDFTTKTDFTTEIQRTQSNHRANGQENLTPQSFSRSVFLRGDGKDGTSPPSPLSGATLTPQESRGYPGIGSLERGSQSKIARAFDDKGRRGDLAGRPDVDDAQITPRPNTVKHQWLTLAVALGAMVALISVVISGRTPPAGDPAQASLPPLVPITAENATQVRQISTLGKGNLYQVAYSPDGATLALAGSRGVWLHRTADLTAPARLLEGADNSFIKRVLAWSPDGSLLAMSNGDSTRVWNPVTGGVVTDLDYPTQVTALAFSPDGAELAVGGGAWDDPVDSTYPVQVWKTQTWQQDQTPVQLGGPVSALAFQPGADRLLAIAFDLSTDAPTWSLMLMRTADKTMQRNEYFDEEGGQVLAFSPDGKVIYSNQRSRIIGWEVESGEQVIESPIIPNDPIIEEIAIRPLWPDGSVFAVATINAGLWLWTYSEPRPGSPALSRLNYTTSVDYSPDGAHMVTLEYAGLVQVWDSQTGEELASIRDYAGNISVVKLSPDEQQVFTADQTGTLRFYDLNTDEEIWRFETDSTLFRDMVDLSADGSLIAYSDFRMRLVGNEFQSSQNKGMPLIDVATGEVQMTISAPANVWGAIRFSPDGSQLLMVGLNGTLLADLTQLGETSGQPLTIFIDTSANGGAFSPDGQFLAFSDTVPDGGALVLYDLLMSQQIYVGGFPEVDGKASFNTDLAWSPDGRTIAMLLNSTTEELRYRIQLFDVEAQTFTLTQAAPEYVYDLAYSPDGSLLAVTVNGRVMLYDATTLAVIAELPQAAAYLVSFSADGSMLLTGGFDGIVRVWGVTE